MRPPFDPSTFTYDQPRQFPHCYTIRITPAPRGIQLGFDPSSDNSLPVVVEKTAEVCTVNIDDPDLVEFFTEWDESNLCAYKQHADFLQRDADFFEKHYRPMVRPDSTGRAQLRLWVGGHSEKPTTFYQAITSDGGTTQLKQCTYEAVEAGSRLLAHVDVWYLGMTSQGHPDCKLRVSDMVVYPPKVNPVPSFVLPGGMSLSLVA